MVDFFFVLSGFVISLSYIDKIGDISSLVLFQQRRFLRLYPLHLIMLVSFVSLELVKLLAGTFAGATTNSTAFASPNDLYAIIANIFLLQNYLLSELTFNLPSWSISAEFYTYAIFGCLALIAGSRRRLMGWVLLLSVVISGSLLGNFGMDTDNISGPLRCLYSFAIGSMVFLIFERMKKSIVISSSIVSAALLAISILVVTQFGRKNFEYIELVPLLFGVTILVVSLTRNDTFIIKLLSLDLLVYLGTISYGIYMIHLFVWDIMTIVLNRAFEIEYSSDPYSKSKLVIENIFIADGIAILGIVTILVCAHMSYRLVETRFNMLTRR